MRKPSRKKLPERGAHDSERNLANNISRGFTAALFMMCMDVIVVRQVVLEA
ncbi:DUF6471 domain-containing protein [Mesorhizobium salmacidum]|uniref:DUF6471 domain-containing protein n=1 Tax=Mesorhizobium salmacidum TaxID=3015171 RepID=UPI0039F586E5